MSASSLVESETAMKEQGSRDGTHSVEIKSSVLVKYQEHRLKCRGENNSLAIACTRVPCIRKFLLHVRLHQRLVDFRPILLITWPQMSGLYCVRNIF